MSAEKPSGRATPLRAAPPCPICGKPSIKDNYPFCSARCTEVDLNNWLSGAYAIPAIEEDEPSDPGEEGRG